MPRKQRGLLLLPIIKGRFISVPVMLQANRIVSLKNLISISIDRINFKICIFFSRMIFKNNMVSVFSKVNHPIVGLNLSIPYCKGKFIVFSSKIDLRTGTFKFRDY